MWVVVHIYDIGREDCAFVDELFRRLACRHTKTKFVRMHYQQALPELHSVASVCVCVCVCVSVYVCMYDRPCRECMYVCTTGPT